MRVGSRLAVLWYSARYQPVVPIRAWEGQTLIRGGRLHPIATNAQATRTRKPTVIRSMKSTPRHDGSVCGSGGLPSNLPSPDPSNFCIAQCMALAPVAVNGPDPLPRGRTIPAMLANVRNLTTARATRSSLGVAVVAVAMIALGTLIIAVLEQVDRDPRRLGGLPRRGRRRRFPRRDRARGRHGRRLVPGLRPVVHGAAPLARGHRHERAAQPRPGPHRRPRRRPTRGARPGACRRGGPAGDRGDRPVRRQPIAGNGREHRSGRRRGRRAARPRCRSRASLDRARWRLP